MSNPITTPVKSPINPNARIDSTVSTPVKEEDDEMLIGTFSAMKVTQGANLAKRCADAYTIEGSPVNVNHRYKKRDFHPTPLRASFYGGHDFDETPLQRNIVTGTLSQSVAKPFAKPTSTSEHDMLLVICSASEEHNTGDHQENALRTALLCGPDGCLRRPEVNEHIKWINSDNLTAAPLTDLLRVHEYTYLKYIEDKCRAAAMMSSAAEKGTPNNHSVAAQFPSFYAPPGMLDSDTPLQPQSLEAAKRFCGAAILAVDHVMASTCNVSISACNEETNTQEGGECSRAFVIGRPPGHHAGPHGCVPSAHFWQRPDMASSGFCLLNTVAVAAAYARHQYGRWAWRNTCMSNNPISSRTSSTTNNNNNNKNSTSSSGTGKGEWRAPRIAIVDIDIHHGNGTEEIVRNLSPRQVHLPLPSSWAPVSTLSYKPWLNEQDTDEVFFSSVHLYAGDRFYPCSGPDSFPEKDTADSTTAATPNTTVPISTQSHPTPSERIVNIALTPIGPGPWDRKARAKLTPAQRDTLCKQASAEFRSKVNSMLLPRLEAFNPDLLFISAGFDAHHDDWYHFLTEQDLHWVTEQLCAVADRCGSSSNNTSSSGSSSSSSSNGVSSGEKGGKRKCGVISVLEGGYSLSSPLPPATKSKTTKAAPAAAPAAVSVINFTHSGISIGNSATGPTASVVEGSTGAAVGGGGVASPNVEAAAAVLGRGGRGKAKKGTTSAIASPPASLPVPAEPVVKVELTPTAAVPSTGLSYKQALQSAAAAEPAVIVASVGTSSANVAYCGATHEETMYAQRPGDGGLVKGVLAHAAALVGRKTFLSK
eukprot:gene11509-13377_t